MYLYILLGVLLGFVVGHLATLGMESKVDSRLLKSVYRLGVRRGKSNFRK